MSERPQSAPLLSSVLSTVLTRGALLPLSVLQGALLARALLPAGLGHYSALLTDINLVVALLSLGLPGALGHLAGNRPERLRALLLLSLRCGAWLLLPAIVACATAYARPEWAGRLSRQPVEIVLIAAAVVFQYLRDATTGLFMGMQHFHAQNLQNATLALLQVAALALLYGLGALDPYSALLLQIGSNLLLMAWVVRALLRNARRLGLWRPDDAARAPALLGEALRIGWRNFLHALPALLLMRIDVYLIQNLMPEGHGRHGLGIYQAGVRIAELVLIIPGALNTILFAKASAREQVTSATLASAKLSLYIGLACLALMGIVGQYLLILFYGSRFAGSFLPCLLVLLGCLSFCYSSPLAGTLAGEGAYPRSVILSQVAALVVNVAANLYLIPRHGITGAALSSTVAYTASGLILAAAFSLRYRVGAWEMMRLESPITLLRRLRGQGGGPSTGP